MHQQEERERPPLCTQASKQASRPVGICVIPHTWGGQPRVCVHSLFRHKHTFFLCHYAALWDYLAEGTVQ